ncbi:hypothetical protein FRB90_011271 [Tulasnella sp. 427]|nr:hypothetical protein FRB90_011271 [Tulasnella sp. 427]
MVQQAKQKFPDFDAKIAKILDAVADCLTIQNTYLERRLEVWTRTVVDLILLLVLWFLRARGAKARLIPEMTVSAEGGEGDFVGRTDWSLMIGDEEGLGDPSVQTSRSTLLIEAKRPGADLKTHLPQVIAESIT